jgi:Mg2+-importing ATPase
MSDLPALAIASDTLDAEQTLRPQRWKVHYIRNLMITFGLVSSLFDYLTFGLLFALAVPMLQFRTSWFLESLLTEIVMLLVLRTRRLAVRSRPAWPLLLASAGVAVGALLLPYLPGAALLGFTPLPPALLAGVLGLTLLLGIATEAAKHAFYARPALWRR